MDKKRVLHIKGSLSSDGATVIEYNFANQLHSSVVFDWLLDAKADKGWEKKFQSLGSKVYYIKYRRSNNKIINSIRKYKAYQNFFKFHEYSTIHIDTDGFHRLVELYSAKRAGVSHRIVHSHNTNDEVKGFISRNKLLIPLGQKLYSHYATKYVACSEEAGFWLFGTKNKNKTICLKNGIDIEKYMFSPLKRSEAREQLGINESCTLYGHVGRFEAQKNHEYLISVFKEIHNRNKNAKLLLIGEGSLKNSIISLVRGERLESEVIFIGNVDNVDFYYNAMDLFLFPSNFEGLGIVAIEAQCSGLPVLMSNNVPKQAKVTQECIQLPLDDIELWVDKAEELSVYDIGARKDKYKRLEATDFDIKNSVKVLCDIYKE